MVREMQRGQRGEIVHDVAEEIRRHPTAKVANEDS
jgi:hypothetical protein